MEEKPYTDENDVVCWHYSHSKSAHVKGINILTSMVTYKNTSVPIGYETVLKDIKFTDLKDRKEKRKSNIVSVATSVCISHIHDAKSPRKTRRL